MPSHAITQWIVRHRWAWVPTRLLLAPPARIYRHLWAHRVQHERETAPAVRAFAAEHLADHAVRHGPFTGLRYPPDSDAVGSALLPKLLGCYEAELHPILNAALSPDADPPYTSFVDVGCAEGYYAVGIARQCPSLTVHAFDNTAAARERCAAMAALNGVAGRVAIHAHADGPTLAALPLGTRALILLDCEGYEAPLVDSLDLADPRLAGHDWLIETHDFLDPAITPHIRDAFAPTHTITEIESTDDTIKADRYDYPELQGLDLETRRSIVRENRPTIQRWLWITPRRG